MRFAAQLELIMHPYPPPTARQTPTSKAEILILKGTQLQLNRALKRATVIHCTSGLRVKQILSRAQQEQHTTPSFKTTELRESRAYEPDSRADTAELRLFTRVVIRSGAEGGLDNITAQHFKHAAEGNQPLCVCRGKARAMYTHMFRMLATS